MRVMTRMSWVGAVALLIHAVPAGACIGDCDGDGNVVVSELIKGVNISLDNLEIADCPAFDGNDSGAVEINELIAGVNNSLDGCTPVGTPTATPTQGEAATPTPSSGLGRRHFTVNPAESFFKTVLGFQFSGFEGFMDLEAGEPDPETGVAFVDVVDSSDFISLSVTAPAPVTICIRPDKSQFPVVHAGAIACNGGEDTSLIVTQDHNIGTVDTCLGGDNDGLACAVDGDCPGGECFSDQDCTDAGGGPDTLPEHAGVCNGPLLNEVGTGDSGPGALIFAPNPDNPDYPTLGIPVEITAETGLPCGDEPGTSLGVVDIAFTTGTARATIFNAGNTPGNAMVTDEQGENFSCENWTQEDGPGTLVLVAPIIDLSVPPLGTMDVNNVFVLSD